MPSQEKVAATTDKSNKPRFGLTLAVIDEQTRTRFSVGKNIEGVVVTAVEPGSIAAEKGLGPAMACAVSGVRKFPTLPKYPGFLQRLSNSPETTNAMRSLYWSTARATTATSRCCCATPKRLHISAVRKVGAHAPTRRLSPFRIGSCPGIPLRFTPNFGKKDGMVLRTVAILSLGDMGRVGASVRVRGLTITVLAGRSDETRMRAERAGFCELQISRSW